jgi:hypothetical protein
LDTGCYFPWGRAIRMQGWIPSFVHCWGN